ncbi:right-handed parallel beta-helix repeat-containing protein [bacterium]|nr:right-handed parallel beta-helix repeat-containing protein [bacterium]
MATQIVTVGPTDGDVQGADNRAIQIAIDGVAERGGGQVTILPGAYTMHDSLHLRSGVHVVGSARDTVLRKAPEARSPLSADLGYGHYDVSLAEPEGFAAGMGVLITDSRAGGFYDTVATLTWRDGRRFGASRMLNHDYARRADGFVVSSFPIVSAVDVADASVSSLAIDGNQAENPHRLNGCRGGGVFLLGTTDVALRDLHIADVNGDGISFQQTTGSRIVGCACESNAGHGLHPGSGSVGAVLRGCACRGNGEDGIFYCLRVSYSLCEGCRIEGNGRDGISIGGRDTDHLIRNNTIRGNGRCGIFFRPSDRVMAGSRNHIEGNELAGNCVAEGDAEIDVAAPVCDVHLLANRIQPATEVIPPIRITDGAERVVVHGNTDGDGRPIVLEGALDGVSADPPAEPLAVGPDAAPPGATRHLLGTYGAPPSSGA